MLDAFLEKIGAIAVAASGQTARDLIIGGSEFRIVGQTGLMTTMCSALDHHRHAAAIASLTIHLWSDGPAPMEIAPAQWQARKRWARREPVRAGTETGMAYFDPVGRAVSFLDTRRRRAGLWIEDAGSIPVWIAAAPFLRIFDWWFLGLGKLVCHGAAFALDGAAALIVGMGGSGKSTLATRSLAHGFDYLGDDYVLLGHDREVPLVHNLFSSAKLDAVEDLPKGLSIQRRPGPGDNKYWLKVEAGRVLSSAPLRLVVAPVIRDADCPSVEPITRGQAIQAALPSTLQQLPGNAQKKLDILSRCLAVCCVRQRLCRYTDRNLAAVGERLAVPVGAAQ